MPFCSFCTTMFLEWLLVACLSCDIFATANASVKKNLQRSAMLGTDRRFHMEWGNGDDEVIYIKLEVQTLGYVAIGFSKDGTMVDSDIVIGWVSNGEIYLQDRHGEGNRMPELDHQQDYELISGSENATHTTIFFRRKWNTCDHQDFRLEYDNAIRVMYAYSYIDPVNLIEIPFFETARIGWKTFLLLQPEFKKEETPYYWEVMNYNFSVSPQWHTLYWCKLFKTPDLKQKHHVVTAEPVFLGGSRGGYIHHFVIYECAGAKPREYDPYVGHDGFDCSDPNGPSWMKECDGFTYVWARGGGDIVFPDHIGFPLEANKYLMLQVHYDNFNRDVGLPGTAGFRFHHTPHLRQYDAGYFGVNVRVRSNVMAPPGVKDYVVAAHSNPDCMGLGIPPEGIKLVSTHIHTHLLGTALKNRHFRNNVELPTLVYNKHYDPDYQEYHIFKEEVLLLPNDQITVECTYDSTGRTTTTFGGNSTREEMCGTFIVYYPRVEGLYTSGSLVSKKNAVQILGSPEIMRLTSNTLEYDKTFKDAMVNYNWNRTSIRRFEKETRFAELDTYCRIGTGKQGVVTSRISYPEVFQEYVEKQSQCPGDQHKNEESYRFIEEYL